MAAALEIAGSTKQKATRFSPIYTGRWSSGLWTNRSPLRDAASTRISEKFYGAAGDALIAGNNVEITNRLTLARRPGNPIFDANTFTNVDRFEEFRLFSTTAEQIDVMVDQADKLFSLFNGTKTLVWTKTAGAGQTYMQSVGNTLYFSNGIDNKKWLQSLNIWTAFERWTGPLTGNTFLIDPNQNIQQLIGTKVFVSTAAAASDTITIVFTTDISQVLTPGLNIRFAVMTGVFTPLNALDGTPAQTTATTFNILTVSGSTITFKAVAGSIPNTGTTAQASGVGNVPQGGTPISGATTPSWSTVTPNASNNFQGGITLDGSAVWDNRGVPNALGLVGGLPSVENWGIVAPITPLPTPTFIGAGSIWQANTVYSLPGVVVDTNGNLQMVTTAGKSGAVNPTWSVTINTTTPDGTVIWTMIQTAASLIWAAGTAYHNGMYSITGFPNLVPYVLGSGSLFALQTFTIPTLSAAVALRIWGNVNSGDVGSFNIPPPFSSIGAPLATASVQSLSFDTPATISGGSNNLNPILWNTTAADGTVTGTTNPFPAAIPTSTDGAHSNFQISIVTTINIPVAGVHTFVSTHHDGLIWGFGPGPGAVLPIKVSGLFNDFGLGQTTTAVQSYPIMAGQNRGLEGIASPPPFPAPGTEVLGQDTETLVVNFPVAGNYGLELDFAYWKHLGRTFILTADGATIINGPPISGATQPVWPAFTLANAPAYATVTESNGNITWANLGPSTPDFAWKANVNYTLPDTIISDTVSNSFQGPFETGVSGAIRPTFATGANQITLDNGSLNWINLGPSPASAPGTILAANGGFQYVIALVNTLDSTVSNAGPVSITTGNFSATGIVFAPGAGLNPLTIDPQADYVAIFRTTDGGATFFLIPGTGNSIYTVSLAHYLTVGYTDTTPDTGLNNLISAALSGENTPPAVGAINLAFHLSRLFYSIGNVVYWTSGPATPVGNGVNGTAPLNFDSFPSLVKRIVPTNQGAFVLTVSDIFIIPGLGTVNNPIIAGQLLLKGIGILSYNALDVNGSIIGFYSTDNQFITLDPSGGVSYLALPIGDQFRKNTGNPGTSWNAANVYVTWHASGEDQAWYVSDGQFGWFRLMPTPAPETGLTWSPFATIVGGAKAVQSIETLPGVHNLLIGPTTLTTGPILKRDLSTFQDSPLGTPTSYLANAVIGSMVLAHPGQIAAVAFITLESVRIGSPISIGVIMDEAVPYYTGPFEALTNWTNDPPNQPESLSIRGQRFYLAELENQASVCRHMQVQINMGLDSVQTEILSMVIFGAIYQEQ